jgi:hypothetical protein
MENNFKICYDGPALANHEMNVKDIAPALLAMGELLEEANKLINGDKTKVAVNIKATNPGSVDVLLTIVQDLIPQLKTLFTSSEVTAIVNAAGLLGIIGLTAKNAGGIIGFLKWQRGRKIKNVITIEGEGYKIELDDGDSQNMSFEELKLFRSVSIRKNLEVIIKKPLEQEGIDKVSFNCGEQKSVEIKKEQREYFLAPDVEQELISEKEEEMNLQLIGISFQEGGKWRFTDGNATFFAEIKDDTFIEKVKKNEEVFAKDDVYSVLAKKRQYLSKDGIKTDYEVLKILEHRSAAVQIKLPFSNNKKI